MEKPVSVVVDVEITGIAPLLQNNIAGSEEQMLGSRNRKRTSSGVKDDPEEWKIKLYKYNGTLGHPGPAIESALVKAARDFKADKRRTMKDLVKALVFVNEEFIDLGKKEPDNVNRASIVNPVTHGRGFVYRPMFNTGWQANFSLTLADCDIIPVERLKEMLEYAGYRIGIGDWRPKFGRFYVSKFSVRAEAKTKRKK